MDLSFVSEMYIPMVVVACLVIGYITKKWIADVDNKFIPTIVCVAGAILACVIQQTVDVSIIVAGAVSGLGSTGLHQLFVQLIEGKN